MDTAIAGKRAVRRIASYTAKLAVLTPSDRRAELAILKYLYEQEQLTVRQLADLLDSSYCFALRRLAEAGAHTEPDRRRRRPVSAAATALLVTLPSQAGRP